MIISLKKKKRVKDGEETIFKKKKGLVLELSLMCGLTGNTGIQATVQLFPSQLRVS